MKNWVYHLGVLGTLVEPDVICVSTAGHVVVPGVA